MFALVLAACGRDGPNEPPPPVGVLSLAVGEGRTLTASQAATIEISGGSAGGEFVLIPFHASQVATSTVALEFAGTQMTGVTGPPSPQVGPADATPSFNQGLGARASEDVSFHTALRRQERELLVTHGWAARAARADRMQVLRSASVAVPAVGDQMTLNVNAKRDKPGERVEACFNADLRTGTVMAVTTRAVIVADNANPSGGFEPAEYAEIGQAFDALVHPVVTQNFGVPGDIDSNQGRSVVFYTRAVNELTSVGSQSVIFGFFHPRDLFPKAGPNPGSTNDDCPTSNQAEMFYMLVPDPTGQVNGNVRTKESVRRSTVGVLGHEYQHLINASLRIANDRPGEEVWLNEGLSHIAEELLFYSASELAPRQNITFTTLRSSEKIRDAVNAYQVSNFGRLIEYLEDPEARSPYANDDELATRGATWQLLRYAADRSSTAQQTLWLRLANSTTSGIANFTAAFGGEFFSIVRDWATAQYTDDAVAQTAPSFQHPSWHYRSVIPALINPTTPPPYPLKTRTLAGTPLSLTLKGGSAAYLRFGVAAGVTAIITPTSSGGALPAAVSLTVLRTK
jgi:hypothetical protein